MGNPLHFAVFNVMEGMRNWSRNSFGWAVCAMAALAFGMAAPARADVGLVLNSSLDTGSSWVTGAGHAAVYLSRICAASPTELRMCGPGENGSVLSNYANFQETKPYEWNVIPVEIFLYGVEHPEYRSLFGTLELRAALQSKYRQEHLADICSSVACVDDPDANWRDMVGATFVRTVYIFKVRTTVQQDEAFVRYMNTRANVNHYSGFHYNCADFAKNVMNFFLDDHVHANRFNDFGMTSPKAIARSLTHYAAKHKELGLSVAEFAQLPSDLPRSEDPRIGTQTTITTAKFVAPLVWLEPHSLALFAATYIVSGRFSIPGAVRKYPEDAQFAAVRGDGSTASARAADEARSAYQRQLPQEIAEARALNVIDGANDLKEQLRALETTPMRLDADGRPFAILAPGREIGLAADAPVPPPVQPAETYALQLARVNFLLHANASDREPAAALRQDWARMEQLREAVAASRDDKTGATLAAGN